MNEAMSKALALLAAGHGMRATAERMRWPYGVVRRMAERQKGWLVVDGRVTCPGQVHLTVPDGVRREHLEWARRLLQDAPAPRPARTLPPATRRPGAAAAARPEEPVEVLAPRPVAELVSVPEPPLAEPVVTEPEVPAVLTGLIAAAEPSTGSESVIVTSVVAEVVPPAPSAAASVRRRSKASGNIRRRSESSGDVRDEPKSSEETAPEQMAEPAVDEAVDEAPGAEEPTKRCPRCDTFKPHSEFYLNRETRDGLSIWCRACFRAVRS